MLEAHKTSYTSNKHTEFSTDRLEADIYENEFVKETQTIA